MSGKPKNLEIVNRRAKYEFHFINEYEAGIMLTGTEIKSIRLGHCNLSDAYCYFDKGELWIKSMYVKEYKFGTYSNHEPRRNRKLLLKKSELRKLEKKVKERGFSIIPYRLYLSERNLVKLEIALGQGKRAFDKRNAIKERENKRDLARIKKMY